MIYYRTFLGEHTLSGPNFLDWALLYNVEFYAFGENLCDDGKDRRRVFKESRTYIIIS